MQQTRIWPLLAVALGLASAFAGAYSVTAIYREGNLLAWGLALLLPLAALLAIYRDFGKRVLAVLMATLLVSTVTRLWLAVGHDFGTVALLSVVLVGLIAPISVDLIMLDSGRRLAVNRALAYTALATFLVVFAPLVTALIRQEHRSVIQSDYALIREVVQHVQLQDKAIVFDHVDPKRKTELKNRVAVSSEGKSYPLSNAHFESVSRESTVRKQTEKRGSSETTVVSRQRDEEMRVVVDVDRKPTNIVLYSTRGPLTICWEEIWPTGDEQLDEPVS
jgi:hypothetical protein